MKSGSTIRVVVIEDSRLQAEEISRALESHSRIQVVGVAHDGESGRQLVSRTRPDVVTIDVHMPVMDGLTCMQYIMVEQPTPCIIVSALTGESSMETFEAFELGAVDVIQKPQGGTEEQVGLFQRRLTAKILRASFADPTKLQRFQPAKPLPSKRETPSTRTRTAADSSTAPRSIVVIGASTGGPRTVMDILSRLPADFETPVLVIQHMPGSFTPSFSGRLNQICALNVCEAREGQRIAPGNVYVAPGDFHLRLEPVSAGLAARVKLDSEIGDEFVRPSVDIALESAVNIYGPRTVGVVLTGIGEDGARGMEAVQAAGGVTIAESEVSAVIYGMPKAVVERGAASQILPSRKIPEAIVAAAAGMEDSR